MNSLRNKLWKATKCVEMEQENWLFFHVKNPDIADL